MPMIDAKCEDCNQIQELLIKFSQVDENDNVQEVVCNSCGSTHLKKILSVSNGSFQLKGNGWFKSGGY